MDLNLPDIHITAWNPRKNFDEEELTELQASIEQYGILEPLIVRPVNDSYQLVAGERRYRAASNLGLQTVPVVIKELTDAEVHEIMLIENLQRSSLEPLEEAQSLQVILSQGKVTQGELAARLGKTQPWVANRLRLLQAPEELKDLLISREISSKHVIAALPFSGYPVMKAIVEKLKEKLEEDKNCSVNDLLEIIEDSIRYDELDSVLRIDNLDYDYRKYKEYIDFSKCKDCKHIVKIKQWGSEFRYCLNKNCWSKIIDAAVLEYHRTVDESLLEMAEKGIVDISLLDNDSYEVIRQLEIDSHECESCDNYRKTTDNYMVCLDPECYKKKQRSHTRSKNRRIKQEKKCVWEAVDSWIKVDTHVDERWILRCLIFSGNDKLVIKALSPWGELTSTNPYMDIEAVDKFVSSIPEDNVMSAIVRVLCYCRLGQYSSVSLELLQRFVPAAAEYYIPPEASE